MKRFKITLMVPHEMEVVVSDAQAAHNEASRLIAARHNEDPVAFVHSVTEIGDVRTEPRPYDLHLEFGDDIPE